MRLARDDVGPHLADRPPMASGLSSEADLVHLWEGQRFPAALLLTRHGERLRVVYRGRRQQGPGPDFRDAIIAAPACLLSGDIEVHVQASNFRRHGHHLDPAYDNVILHLVFWDDESVRLAIRDDGPGFSVSVLASLVEPYVSTRGGDEEHSGSSCRRRA